MPHTSRCFEVVSFIFSEPPLLTFHRGAPHRVPLYTPECTFAFHRAANFALVYSAGSRQVAFARSQYGRGAMPDHRRNYRFAAESVERVRWFGFDFPEWMIDYCRFEPEDA